MSGGPGTSAPLLELSGVARTYQRRTRGGRQGVAVPAVCDVSITVRRGEILGLVGESGAGKTTLTRLILGLERPDAGTVRFDGQDLGELSRSQLRNARRRMHLILQDPYDSLHPGMRIAEAVAEPLAIARTERAERAERAAAALSDAGLNPPGRFLSRYPHQLSGGQRQRVAIARAIVGRPRLVIADEPTSMVDASLRAGILESLLGMRERLGTTFLFITHDLALARYVGDRIAVMQAGRIVESGPAEQLLADPRHSYTRELIDASERVRI